MAKGQRAKPIHYKSPFYKYYMQRYSLFSRFDDGIQMDEESWYSVTPENIAKHIAYHVVNAYGHDNMLIVDGFCGVGGNLIQFACESPSVRVIGCDISLDKIQMAKNNAKIYGVQRQCEFIHGDFTRVMRSLGNQRVDAVFLSPPWGGLNYQNVEKYSLDSMRPNGYDIVHGCREHLTNNIAMLLPRNVDECEFKKRLLVKNYPTCEWEENKIGKKIKTITVYFGDLISSNCDSDASEVNYLMDTQKW